MKALVLMEPWGALFDWNRSTSVDMSTLLYRAEGGDLKPDGNNFALAEALPHSPRQEMVPGGHFIIVEPNLALLEAEAPGVCEDAPDVDRIAIHHRSKRRSQVSSGENVERSAFGARLTLSGVAGMSI